METAEANPGDARPLSWRLRKRLGRIRRRFTLDRFDVFVRVVPERRELEGESEYLFRWGGAADVLACDPYHTELDERERHEGVRRLELGHRVVLGMHEGRVVFSMWVNPRNLNVPGLLKRRLAPGQWFIYKAFTSPDHRGRRLYQTGMRFVLTEMSSRGLSELVGYAHVKKRASRGGLARLGFESAGRVVSLQLPGYRRTFLSRRLARRFAPVDAAAQANRPARSGHAAGAARPEEAA